MPEIVYHRPSTLAEALTLLASLGPNGAPVAGATDVWVNMKLKKLKARELVSVRTLPELTGLAFSSSGLTLGACVPHAALEDSAQALASFPALAQACGSVGSRQVRNVATVGGNICNGAPSADAAVALLLYDAVAVAVSTKGERKIALSEFFVSPGVTALEKGELLARIEVPATEGKTFSGYIKHTRRNAMELPLLGVGALVSLADDGKTIAKARIALGVAGPVVTRALEAEMCLEGKPLTREVVEEAAKGAAECASVRDSWRGKAWYRREMIRVLIPRALAQAGAFGGEVK